MLNNPLKEYLTVEKLLELLGDMPKDALVAMYDNEYGHYGLVEKIAHMNGWLLPGRVETDRSQGGKKVMFVGLE